jgi:hypothetical protein
VPRWFRTPKGIVTRRPSDWYAHQRGRCSIQWTPNLVPNTYTSAIALTNTGLPPVYLHVFGVQVYQVGAAQIYAHYVGQPPPATGNVETVLLSPTVALYSNDPTPPGAIAYGVAQPEVPGSPGDYYAEPFLFIAPNGSQIQYNVEDLFVISPGETLEIFSGLNGRWEAMFDYYYLPE